MTSGEYLKQLEKYLRKLPQSDYEDAMEYFTEYFADAGPENEQAVIKELGTPKQAAAELMRNLLDKKVDEREAMEKEEKQKEKKKTTGAENPRADGNAVRCPAAVGRIFSYVFCRLSRFYHV